MEAPPSPLSSRPKRSEVEGSAVPSSTTHAEWKRHPPLCHPDRSEAERRDLRSPHPQTRAEWKLRSPLFHPDRSGGICSPLIHKPMLNGSSALPFVIPTGAEGSAVPSSTNPC